tara:strand:+ start:4076 stop:5338 length:1263 start_codon:yes stop_codon:yes gene_type:complete
MPQNIIFTSGSILFTTTSIAAPTGSSTTGSTSGHAIFVGSNPANNVSMSGDFTGSTANAVTIFTSSFMSVSVSDSLAFYGNVTTTGSFEQFVPISESNGSYSHSRYTNIDHNGTSSIGPMQITGSLQLGFNQEGEWSISKPKENLGIGAIGSDSEKTFMYVSRSGKLGFKTTSPTDDIDFKANSIKFRSDDGTKEMEFANGRIITKKFANREVGAETEVETSGSEIILTYSPGTFDSPTTASSGDVLGTIAWEDESLGRVASREAATAMRIRGVVNGVAVDGSAIKASMNFGIGSSDSEAPVTDYAILTEGAFHITHSAGLFLDNGILAIGNLRANPGDADRRLLFYNPTSTQRWVMGVDTSQNKFAINNSSAFVNNNEFELDGAGNIIIQGDLYADQLRATGGYPNFTGSVLAIDGGSF